MMIMQGGWVYENHKFHKAEDAELGRGCEFDELMIRPYRNHDQGSCFS